MTETLNTTTSSSEQPAPELSGVDLARIALHQAREAAKARGESGTRKAKRRIGATVRRDGREPTGFAAVLQGLMADRAWDVPAAGGSVLDQWPAIAASLSPKLAAHVQAVAFHAETGQLDLRPDSPAYATQLRLITSRIVAAANDAVGTQAVRTVRVLAVGATAPVPREAVAAPTAAAAPEAPVKTRDMAPPGFHRPPTAHQAVPRVQHVSSGVTEAIERQNRAMRELSRRAFPDPEPDPDGGPSPLETARAQRRREADASHAAALRLARQERAARAAGHRPDREGVTASKIAPGGPRSVSPRRRGGCHIPDNFLGGPPYLSDPRTARGGVAMIERHPGQGQTGAAIMLEKLNNQTSTDMYFYRLQRPKERWVTSKRPTAEQTPWQHWAPSP
ncbi:DciA family protein [Streptomyces albidochromogenes]|uniref:DciA family protein n=1 Tax=Streptomyces albidochromogenes TaxID=329524 RepID=A0ABW6FHN4_9ACTN